MTRCLVLDWNHDSCRILAGDALRTGVQIERALVWPQPEFFPDDQAEDVGKKLRDFLKQAGMAFAPVLICLPRQRVLLKEIRCPIVPAADEPAVVHFQAAKDLLETPDDVVIDYVVVAKTATENRVLIAALRKNVLAGYQTMCKSAGLKLLAVTPRPFVLAHCLARARRIGETGDAGQALTAPDCSAVVQLGEGWGELTVLHGTTVVFASSLSGDAAVDAEVRRSLVTFASQPQGQSPEVLYLFGDEVSAQAELLHKTLNIPVVCPRFLADADAIAKDTCCPAGVGMLSAWAGEGVPVNFIAPKEPKLAAPNRSRRLVLAGTLGFVVFLFLVLMGYKILERKKTEIQNYVDLKKEAEEVLNSPANKQDRAVLDFLKKWKQESIPWIDELYDLSVRIPHKDGYYLTKMDGKVMEGKVPQAGEKDRGEKDRFAANVILAGIEPKERHKFTEQFLEAMSDPHLQPQLDSVSGQEFTLKIKLAPQPAKSYTTRLSKQASDGEP